MSKLTPHQKIARAHRRGTGCRLTRDDCYKLGFDDAIMTRADNDDRGESADDSYIPKGRAVRIVDTGDDQS